MLEILRDPGSSASKMYGRDENSHASCAAGGLGLIPLFGQRAAAALADQGQDRVPVSRWARQSIRLAESDRGLVVPMNPQRPIDASTSERGESSPVRRPSRRYLVAAAVSAASLAIGIAIGVKVGRSDTMFGVGAHIGVFDDWVTAVGIVEDGACRHLDKNMMVGTLVGFVGAEDEVPEDWLPCDGRELPIADYSELFSAIGRKYSRMDVPSEAFALPDYRGHVCMYMPNASGGLRVVGGEAFERLHGGIPRPFLSRPVVWLLKAR